MEIKTNITIQTEELIRYAIRGEIQSDSRKQNIIPIKPTPSILDIYA